MTLYCTLTGSLNTGAAIMHTNYSCGMACWLSGGSVSFDGSHFTPKPNTAVTIAVWVKVNSTNGTQSIFSTKGFSHNGGQYQMEVT